MMRPFGLFLLMLAAPAAAQTPPAPEAAAPAPDVRSCLPIAQIQSTQVIDNGTIDFRLRDGSLWRNRLPYQCPGLKIERSFSYTTSIPQLCNVDIIRVVMQTAGPMQGASCGLGKFERQPTPPRSPRK